MTFGGSGGIAAMLTLYAGCFRLGGTVAEMATEVDPQEYDVMSYQ